ncbi:MAG: DNA cytosine methyltransferase [Deltaproteobacteria bacterium]|nr:DNA cytosine methyltransferase [Deltaproteobacteria bacterium]
MPRPSTTAPPITVVSVFSGAGGMDLGFRGDFVYRRRRYACLGYNIVLAVDADREACAIYRQNLGPVECSYVSEVRNWPTADVVIGGPSCQPYSAAGKKQGGADERDGVPSFVDVVRRVLPRAFVMENVPGFVERAAFADGLAAFVRDVEAEGYHIKSAVLDAADFGAPQHRRRVFFVGLRDGIPSDTFDFPKPTHGPDGRRPHVTVREAIGDLHFPYHDKELRRAGLAQLAEGERRFPNFGASARRLAADRPFPTIKAADTGSARLYHPWFDRALLMPELLRAQSFPDDFIVPPRTPAIGNAVPPVLAWHLAKSLREALSTFLTN